jgi:hypothetical protein
MPSNSSWPCWSIGVWLDGENGGVTPPGTSREVDTFCSALVAVSECGGEGGRAPASGCAGAAVAGGGTEAIVFAAEVSMLLVRVL